MLLLFLTLDEMNTTISQSKIAQTSPPPSINLVTVNLQYPLLPPTPKILRLRSKYGKYSKIKWRGGVMFLQFKSTYVKLQCIAIIFKDSKEVGAHFHVISRNIQMTSSYLTKLDILLGLCLTPLQNYQKWSNQNIMRYLLWDFNYEKLKILIT